MFSQMLRFQEIKSWPKQGISPEGNFKCNNKKTVDDKSKFENSRLWCLV